MRGTAARSWQCTGLPAACSLAVLSLVRPAKCRAAAARVATLRRRSGVLYLQGSVYALPPAKQACKQHGRRCLSRATSGHTENHLHTHTSRHVNLQQKQPTVGVTIASFSENLAAGKRCTAQVQIHDEELSFGDRSGKESFGSGNQKCQLECRAPSQTSLALLLRNSAIMV